MTIEYLRVYASFAAFERAELARAMPASAPSVSCLTTLTAATSAPASRATPILRARMTACPAKPHAEAAPERPYAAFPRVYASFAEFDRDDRDYLVALADATPAPEPRGDCPTTALVLSQQEPTAQVVRTKPKRVRPKTPRTRLTPAGLRAEGVLEVGRVTDTGMLYVRTRLKLYLMHETWLPDRRLDDYAVQLALNWLENHGLPSYEVASNLGVNDATLRQALLEAGYERALPAQHAAKTSKKLTVGNRRGRFMRRDIAPAPPAESPSRNFNGKSVAAARSKKKPLPAAWLP